MILLAQIIDGRVIARELRSSVSDSIKQLNFQPQLHVILVGDDPASHAYARSKVRACTNVGINCELHTFPETYPQAELEELINQMNNDNNVHGIMIELPLPRSIKQDEVLALVNPLKDVDGVTPTSQAYLGSNREWLFPATPQSVMAILKSIDFPLQGAEVCLVGYGATVGRPLAQLIMRENPTLTICQVFTKDTGKHTREADLVIVAVGRPKLITADMLKPGCTVIDVGINELPDGTLTGDVDYEPACEVAGAITPVPGGVGALTTVIIMQNLLKALHLQNKI